MKLKLYTAKLKENDYKIILQLANVKTLFVYTKSCEFFVINQKGKNELKVRLMSEVIAKVDRYLRRCDSDLENFRNEMEGEHPGITGELEQKALEIDDRSCEPIRKNSSLPQDFEYDEKAFKQAPQVG